MSVPRRETVEPGYDRMAEQHPATKDPEDPLVLSDLGCGAGVPAARWLEPGGPLLATLTMTAYEGEDPDWEVWGAAMRWSRHDAETNRGMPREAGFDIRYAGPAGVEGTRLWVLAREDVG